MLLLRRTEFVDSKLTVIWRLHTLAFMAMLNEQKKFPSNQKHPIFLDLHSSVLFNKQDSSPKCFYLNSSFYHVLLKGRIGKIEQASQIPWGWSKLFEVHKKEVLILHSVLFVGSTGPLESLQYSLHSEAIKPKSKIWPVIKDYLL